MDYELEERECVNGCGRKFRVLPTSKQKVCSLNFCTHDGKAARFDPNPNNYLFTNRKGKAKPRKPELRIGSRSRKMMESSTAHQNLKKGKK